MLCETLSACSLRIASDFAVVAITRHADGTMPQKPVEENTQIHPDDRSCAQVQTKATTAAATLINLYLVKLKIAAAIITRIGANAKFHSRLHGVAAKGKKTATTAKRANATRTIIQLARYLIFSCILMSLFMDVCLSPQSSPPLRPRRARPRAACGSAA